MDNRALGAALPPGWSARQGLVAQVSGRPNKYTRFGEEWWAAWHGSRSLAQMYHDVSRGEGKGGLGREKGRCRCRVVWLGLKGAAPCQWAGGA